MHNLELRDLGRFFLAYIAVSLVDLAHIALGTNVPDDLDATEALLMALAYTILCAIREPRAAITAATGGEA